MKWKTIVGFENYQISDTGLVKSIERKVQRFNGKVFHDKRINERILKTALTGSGYEFVCLRKNNRHHNCRVHRLVASHFVNGRKDGLVVHHKDGNKLNNKHTNLEYVSKQKNTQHYYKSLGKSSGSIHISEIKSILDRVNNGDKCVLIAKEYGVTRNDIAVLCKIIALTGEELTIK